MTEAGDTAPADGQEVEALLARAFARIEAGDAGAAAGPCMQVLAARPDHFEARYLLGLIERARGRHGEAIGIFRKLLQENPASFPVCFNLGGACLSLGLFKEAAASFGHAARLNPAVAEAHLNQGNALYATGLVADALACYDRAVASNPDLYVAHLNRGIALERMKAHEEAAASFRKAVSLNAGDPNAHFNLGCAYSSLHRHAEALAAYDQALALNPAFAAAHLNRGNILQQLERLEEAAASYRQAFSISPAETGAHYGYGLMLLKLGQADRAEASFARAIKLSAGHADAHFGLGLALLEQSRAAEAKASFERVISLNPNHVEAHFYRGNACNLLRRYDDARSSYGRATSLKPDHVEALFYRGRVELKMRKYAEAIDAFTKVRELAPDHPYALGNLLHARMLVCDWSGFDDLCLGLAQALADGRKAMEPFGYQSVAASEADLRRCAEIYTGTECPPREPLPLANARPRQRAERITIGYLCGEFREQATAMLLCGVFERHDKTRFRVVGFDSGWNDGSDYRKRIEASFEAMRDISRLGDLDAARLIQRENVDILVNLNGFFGQARPGVFAYRPAPVQVNYLGFPGTTGAAYMDYILADRVVLPDASRGCYTEKVVRLPHCYQPNDGKRRISPREFGRRELGLPDDGFVYCCFNNTYKITPSRFDSWMDILRRVPGSVLWLLDDSPLATSNLRKEADRRGVDPQRLVFSKRMRAAEHLARHRAADLFLDTLPYNAHTTASDALWAGLPVLTQTGTTFPGRVASSLLLGLGLPELVTADRAAYEELAVALAQDRARLRDIRDTLAVNRDRQPLFDTAASARGIEKAFVMMQERRERGLPPDHMDVAD